MGSTQSTWGNKITNKMGKLAVKHGKKKSSKGKKSNEEQKTKVKSAAELGVAARSLGIAKETKTHKGRKIMEKRQPKLIENNKRSFFIKGHKSSETLNVLLKELHAMRGPDMS